MEPFATFAAIVALALFLQAKPDYPPDRAILLPSADGSVGRIIVSSASGSQEVAEPYAAVAVGEGGAIAAYKESEESIKARHADLLASRPKPAKSYLLYFKSGGNELTAESIAMLEEIKRDAEQRSAVEIRVVGHTDRVGGDAPNEALSLKRAEGIIEKLVSYGIRPQSYEAVGRGEMDPLVPTADGVSEPRNRRVEVSVR